MHFCSTVRKTRIVLVRTISLMIVFSVSSGFVRFLLFNFQRAPLSRDSFYILPRRQLLVNTFFFNLFNKSFRIWDCLVCPADDLIYIISFPLFCQLFFHSFFPFWISLHIMLFSTLLLRLSDNKKACPTVSSPDGQAFPHTILILSTEFLFVIALLPKYNLFFYTLAILLPLFKRLYWKWFWEHIALHNITIHLSQIF